MNLNFIFIFFPGVELWLISRELDLLWKIIHLDLSVLQGPRSWKIVPICLDYLAAPVWWAVVEPKKSVYNKNISLSIEASVVLQ